MKWDDLGSWESLHNHLQKDKDKNIILGDVEHINTKNSYIESTSRLVATLGIENIGVIETPDAVLVFSLQESQLVKKIVTRLVEKKEGGSGDPHEST